MELKYVSPHYQETLRKLAETLCTPERFGAVALAPVVELELPQPTLFDTDAA